MIIKTCPYCGKEFRAKRQSQKFCSKECVSHSYEKKVKIKCKYCGKEIIKNPYQAKKDCYCSIKCSQMANGAKRRKRIIVKCANCGKEYETPSYNPRKYCSRECRYTALKKGNNIIIKNNYAELIIISKKWGEKRALIDIEDIEKIKKYTWQVKYTKATNCFYVVSSQSFNQNEIKLHRYIQDCPENLVVDHINNNPLDNRKSNLRNVTPKINANNVKWNKKNKSGYTGISQTKSGKFNVHHSRLNLGTYETLEEAIKVKQQHLEKIMSNKI